MSLFDSIDGVEQVVIPTKQCRKCCIVKPLDEFRNCARLNQGKDSWCTECRRKDYAKRFSGELRSTNESEPPEKQCTSCKAIKPIENFRLKRNRGRIVRDAQCNPCLTEWFRKWREKNRAKYVAYQRQKRLKKHYGITPEIYDKMVKSQKNMCAICGNQPNSPRHRDKGRDKLVVDHDHSTGKVRGLLCDSCNVGLARFKESQSVLRSAIKYLTLHQRIFS